MNTAQELRAKALRIQHEARAKLETVTETNAADVEAEFDRMIADADALEARAKRFDDLEAREAALNVADARRPSEDRAISNANLTAEERQARAFDTYVRGGDLGREERAELRAQTVGTASEGGYLVPQTWADKLIVGLKAYGPMNDASIVSSLVTAGGGALNLPSLDDTANKGRRIAEGATVNSVSLAFGNKTLGAYKYTTDMILVSSELFQDSAIDIESIVTAAMSERLGRILNQEFTTGTGSSQPMGIVTAATAGVTLASANTILTADNLIDLQHSVDPAYRSAGRFMFNDATFAVVRKLKDTTGAYIWQPGLSVGAPATVLGQAFSINQDMANVGATGNKSVLYGDFSKYVVRNVKGFALKRLDERYADSDQVGFVGFARYDANLLDAKAIRALVNP